VCHTGVLGAMCKSVEDLLTETCFQWCIKNLINCNVFITLE